MQCVKVFATTLIFGILLAVAPTAAMAGNRSIPKDRAGLSNGDWYPYVISKLGALEWWSFAAFSTEVRREDYPSDWTYELAKQNTWEFPRFCFSVFRPKPEVFASLLATIDQYRGDVVWVMHDNCISAMPFHPTFSTFYTSVGMEDADATTFQKSASFRQSAQLPCAAPADRSLNFCIPLNGETTTSPLRVAAVGRSSLGVSWLQVWVDGVKYFTEHDAGTPTQKLMNNYIYLPNGKHAVTMIAKEADGTSIKKTANILVVSPPTP